MGLALSLYALLILIGYATAGVVGALSVLLAVPLTLRMFVSWRYEVRVRRMIQQLPQLLDHTVRSLKSGRTLADAVLHGIDATDQPLKDGMSRIERNVQLGSACRMRQGTLPNCMSAMSFTCSPSACGSITATAAMPAS